MANIGEKIEVLVLDRGFICGPTLHKIKHSYNIDFVIPGKKDMNIAVDAKSLYHLTEKHESEEATAYGVTDLLTWDNYAGEEQSPLSAVVVTRWKEKAYTQGKEKVFLTSLPVDKPLKGLELYGMRTLIENQGFRELKQGWHLTKFPKKSYAAVVAHVFLTLLMCATTSVYRSKGGQKIKEKGIRRYRREHLNSA